MNSVLQIFAPLDRASGPSYKLPFFSDHVGTGIRAFSDAIMNPNRDSDISRHPDDFDLYLLGDFNVHTGVITPVEGGPRLVIQGKQISIQNSLSSATNHDLLGVRPDTPLEKALVKQHIASISS